MAKKRPINQERHIRIYDLHSWTGIVLGIIGFVVCFSGSVAMFHSELGPWEDPGQRHILAEEPAPIMDHLDSWLEELAPGRNPSFVTANVPTQMYPYWVVTASFPQDDSGSRIYGRKRLTHDTLKEIAWREAGANQFLYDLHRDLAWPEALGPRTIGRIIVGLIGMAFLLILISGIVAHTKITKELFTLRYLRSVRLRWQDSHNVLGLWTSPFAFIITFTGAFLGVVALLAPILALLVAKTNPETALAKLGIEGTGQSATGISAPMHPFETLPKTHPEFGTPLRQIVVSHWGDQAARYTAYYEPGERLDYAEALHFNGVTGASVEPDEPLPHDNFWHRTLHAMSPLHYGTFGGMAIKIVYFTLGIVMAIMCVLGCMMYVERRRHGGEGSKSDRFYSRLSMFTTGACAGMPLASVTVLHFDKFYWGSEAVRYDSVVWTYLMVWLATVIYPFVRLNEYRATRELLTLTGIGLIALAPVNWLVTGDFMWQAFHNSGVAVSAWFDLSFILLGAMTLYAAMRIPTERPADKRRSKRAKSAPVTIDHQLPEPAE